ncbi:YhcN/YlaJ family sporulation lipoprotein [Oceanobacillus halotolerans]|uniref:YhcN/YlaJ family sporulation lipoprotein n=1 Tax=Oceanobacillus halotolerans TaxID=2663380 RepID=UPI0013DB89FD|nr:YhcN/YlaJ family sporulation lipoprotein [Oceanobacillus halotolerans]
MKWKIYSLAMAAIIALPACQADNEEGQPNNNNGVEQTRYNNTTGELEQNGQNDANDFARDYDMERDNNTNRGLGGDQTPANPKDDDTGNTQNTGNDGNGNNQNRNDQEYEVADRAADRIAEEINEIDQAYVLRTDNNAYVAAVLDNDGNNNNNQNGNMNNDELSEDVKGEISDIVQSVDSDVENVYVSTNPDFVNLTNNYANDLDNGQPVEGFFDQMGNMIERLFPQNQ